MKDDMIEYNSRLLCALYQDTSFSSDIPDFTILKAKNLLKDNFTKKRNYCIDIVNGIPINVNFAIDKDNVKFQLYDGLRYLGCGNDVLASMQEKTLTHSISTDMNDSASVGINRKAIVQSKMSITDSSKKVDEGLEDMARLLLALYKKADPIINKETEGSERDIFLKTIRKIAPFTQEIAKYLLEKSFRETGAYYIDEIPSINLYKDNPHSAMQKIGYVPIDVDFSLLHFTDYDAHVGEKGCGQKILESYRNILKDMQVDSPSSILTSYTINEWKENKGGEETKTSELDKAKIVKLKNALDNYSGDININCTNEYGRKIVTKIEASELKKADLSELEYAIENHCNPIGVSYGERVNPEINIGFVKIRYLCKRIQDMQKEK